ncbi:cytochrome P450 [Nocardia yunnanensis]|uniref:Cytochrome P450 n=1 Tax=Nocardia yunnanensis TaxID=2382165 RepID=A0A386ZE80_9NOCA|nr:cytochrome P450 [Nocardia yunnanensis]AYF75798.1 cytochrome P450 [Nocardia yunnanensis]
MPRTQFVAAPPAGSDLKQVSGPATNWIAQLLRQRRDPIAAARADEAAYGPLYVLNIFGGKWIIANGPEAAQRILMNKDRVFANGPAWAPLNGPFFERGLLMLDFDEHKSHRSIMQQAFGRSALTGYLDVLHRIAEQHIDSLPEGSVAEGDPVLMHRHLEQLTLDVALEVFMGVRLSRTEAAAMSRTIIDTLHAGAALVRVPIPGNKWWRGLRGRRTLEAFLGERITAARREQGSDLLSVLCQATGEDGTRLTDRDIVNHLIFLLAAAHDTATGTLTNMVFYLAKHPEWQKRARERSLELPARLGYDELGELTELDWILKETTRLFTPIQIEPRAAVADTEVCGYHIPKGSLVVVPTLANHYRTDIYSHPEEFDPERFSDERAEHKRHRMAWAPFGAGPHKCLGQHFAGLEIKTVLHQLLRKFEWEIPEDYVMPVDMNATPLPEDGLPVTLRRR